MFENWYKYRPQPKNKNTAPNQTDFFGQLKIPEEIPVSPSAILAVIRGIPWTGGNTPRAATGKSWHKTIAAHPENFLPQEILTPPIQSEATFTTRILSDHVPNPAKFTAKADLATGRSIVEIKSHGPYVSQLLQAILTALARSNTQDNATDAALFFYEQKNDASSFHPIPEGGRNIWEVLTTMIPVAGIIHRNQQTLDKNQEMPLLSKTEIKGLSDHNIVLRRIFDPLWEEVNGFLSQFNPLNRNW